MTTPKMCPRKQRLAKNLQYVENQAHKEATALRKNGKRLSRAHYGLGILSAILAAAAATTALTEHTAIASICAGIATIKTSAMMYLRTPYDEALAERPTATRYTALASRAHELRTTAPDISAHALEQHTGRLETELETLRLSRYSTPVGNEVSRGTPSRPAQTASEIA
jgi:hypothetical protein